VERAQEDLTRRERQIMDAVYKLGEASVADVRAEMRDPPSYNTVRTLMKVLTQKGFLEFSADGPRYIYRPTTPVEEAQTSALRRLLATFFEGSPTRAMAALMDFSASDLTDDELDTLASLIKDARREGR
jgi:BlaI family penicillinase repressor